MTTTTRRLVKVHEHAYLAERCVDLLDAEWPGREREMRLRQIGKSCDTFPTSFALIEQFSSSTKFGSTENGGESKPDEDLRLLGYVKLSNEMPFNAAIFLESLVIDPRYRRRGLGRFVMQEVERVVREHGFHRITLTTIDQEAFYLAMGYRRSFGSSSSSSSDKKEITKSSQEGKESDASMQPPPPPPPPVSSNLVEKRSHRSSSSSCSPNEKIHMYKDI